MPPPYCAACVAQSYAPRGAGICRTGGFVLGIVGFVLIEVLGRRVSESALRACRKTVVVSTSRAWGGVSVDGGHGIIDNASDVDDIGSCSRQQGVSRVIGPAYFSGSGDFILEVFGVLQGVRHGRNHIVQVVGFGSGYFGEVVPGHVFGNGKGQVLTCSVVSL